MNTSGSIARDEGRAVCGKQILATVSQQLTDEAKEKGQPPLRSDQPALVIIAAVKGNFKLFRSLCRALGTQLLLQTRKAVDAGGFSTIDSLKPLVGAGLGGLVR